jgi:tetrahydromethanopterin S-methyltransferase subunit G
MGEQVAADFSRWFAENVQQELVTNDEYRKVLSRLDVLEERFDHVEERFDRVDERLDRMDERLNQMDERLDAMNAQMNERFDAMSTRMDERFGAMNERMDERSEQVTDRSIRPDERPNLVHDAMAHRASRVLRIDGHGAAGRRAVRGLRTCLAVRVKRCA